MFINVPLNLIQNSVIKDAECLNVFLCLYSNCLKQNKYSPLNSNINLGKDETIATKSYLSKLLRCTENAAQSYIRRLKASGLISIRKAPGCNLNIIRVNTINPNDAQPYIQVKIPGNPFDYITERCRNIFKVYIHLFLLSNQKKLINVFNGMKIDRGELFTSLKSLAAQVCCSVQELRTALKKLVVAGGIVLEGIKSIGLKVKMALYPKVREKKELHHADSQENNLPDQNEDPIYNGLKILYYDLKHNKNHDKFESLVTSVRKDLPFNFPLEKFEDALRNYYKESGGVNSAMLNASSILNYLKKYNNTYQQTRKQKQIDASFKQSKEKSLAGVFSNQKKTQELWQLTLNGYKSFNEGTFNALPSIDISNLHSFIFKTGYCHIPEQNHSLLSEIKKKAQNIKTMHEQLNFFFKQIDDTYLSAAIEHCNNEFEEISKGIAVYDSPTMPIRIRTNHSESLYRKVIERIHPFCPDFTRTYMSPQCVSLCEHYNTGIFSYITIFVPSNFVIEKWKENLAILKKAFFEFFGEFELKFECSS